MGFKIHSTDDGRNPAMEYLPSDAITPKVGMALKQEGGLLTVCSGGTKPAYLCMCEKENAVSEGELLPVIRVLPDMVLGTVSSADMAAVKLGDKVTIDESGLSVTATTAGGAAEIVAMEDTAAGAVVLVRFQ